LPQRSQITFGGGPCNAAISAKSASSVTNAKPLRPAYAHNSPSLARSSPASRACDEPGNKSANCPHI
jgi:hypothetical protein